MRKGRFLVLSCVLFAAFIAGCGGGGPQAGAGSPTSAAMGIPTSSPPSAQEAPIPTSTSELTPAQAPAEVSYTGPLFLVHEHVHGLTPQELEAVIALWEQEGVSKALAFVGADQLPLWKRYKGRLFPSNDDNSLMDVKEYPAHLREVFQQDAVWAATGELGGCFIVDGVKLCQRPGEGRIPADHPDMFPIYDVAAEFNKLVMMHPLGQPGQDRNPLNWPITEALDRAFSYKPNAPFLLHNTITQALWAVYMGRSSYEEWHNWFRTMFARHPNLSFDPSVIMTPHMAFDPEFFLGQSRTGAEIEQHHEEVVWGRTSAHFLDHMKDETHFRWHVDLALQDWEPLFLAYPDRFMIGIDSDYREPG